MGTRSLTVIQNIDYAAATPSVPIPAGIVQDIVVMYRQFDGYPSGHGAELTEFLAPFKLVNGYGLADAPHTTANGMGCLAAQIVAHFKKDGVGGFYLEPVGTRGVGEEYIYTVYPDRKKNICVRCESVNGDESEVIYNKPVTSVATTQKRKTRI